MVKLLYDNMDELLGNTPMVTLSRLPDVTGASIHAKLDYYNPGRSVKDRVAWNMIRDAESRGLLKPGGKIIEPTAGNTSVSLTLLGRRRGYEVIIVMPDTDNAGLQKELRLLGAKLDLTPPDEGLRGARERVQKLCKRNPDYFYPDQFNNPSNPEIHRNKTAREILKGMGAIVIDAFVAAVGTGGTITGVGEVLKAKNPDIKIIAVEPAESPVLSGGRPGIHSISGIGAGFIPPILNMDIIDSVECVSTSEARIMTEKIRREEGLLAGISSGAVLTAATRVASGMKKNQNVVAFFADAMPGIC
jgi:cysteine synthase A